MFQIKVGDEIGVARSTRYGYQNASYQTVTKINGHGHIILDDGRKFDKRGREYKGGGYGYVLVNTAQLRKSVADKAERDERKANVRRLIALLEGSFGYSGTVHLSDEERAEIQSLVAKI